MNRYIAYLTVADVGPALETVCEAIRAQLKEYGWDSLDKTDETDSRIDVFLSDLAVRVNAHDYAYNYDTDTLYMSLIHGVSAASLTNRD